MSTTPPPAGTPPPYRTSTPASHREVTVLASQIPPPSPLYVQAEDQLGISFIYPTFTPTGNFTISYRFLRPDGEIVTAQKQIPFSGTSSFTTIFLGEGFLLSISLGAISALPRGPGGIWATANIVRNTTGITVTGWNLIADYLDTTHNPSWPYGTPQFSEAGPGRLRSITGTTPALGAEISETVPGSTRWRLSLGNTLLTTSATVANRNIAFVIDDGTNILYRWASSINLTAGGASRNTFASPNVAGLSDNTGQILFIPDNLFLDAGYRFRTVTNGLQANDQYSAPQYLVQEWVST